MIPTPTDTEPTTERRVFEAWSVEVPAGFAEAFITEEGDYWHAYDEHRSVSMSSVVLTEHGVPVSADRILERVEPLDGSPVEQLPPGLSGRAALCPAPRSSRASRFLSGVLATHGRVLMVTITSDDPEWILRVWQSIRSHPAPLEPLPGARKGKAARRWAH